MESTNSKTIDSETPFKFGQTGETLCADCAIQALGGAMPEESSPAIEKFLEETIKAISIKSDVDPTLFMARCKTLVTSDVEIRRTARGYDITFYRLLMANQRQTEKVINYVVNWIRDNPLEIRALTSKCVGPQQLRGDGLFVFLFIPASRPFPDDADIIYMSNQIAPGLSPNKLGWRILLQPQDGGAENHAFIADAVRDWSLEQSAAKDIKLAPMPVATKSGRKLVCFVACRETGG